LGLALLSVATLRPLAHTCADLLLAAVHATLVSLLLPHAAPLALLCSAHGFLSALGALARGPLSLCAAALAAVAHAALLARLCPPLPPTLALHTLSAPLVAMAWPDAVSLVLCLLKKLTA
jgi:hypothetical protein